VEQRLTNRTKAVMAVHYGGQPADLDELRDVCQHAGAALLEDAAQAHGVDYRGRPVGGIGDAAMFSFTPTKNITTGEGGMVTTNNSEWAERLRLSRNHGQADLYHHVSLGYNWRITEMQAAMGVVQMTKLDGILERKRINASYLAERLAATSLKAPVCLPDRTHGYMLYTLLAETDNRDHILDGLARRSIEARIYFPPAHTQPIYSDRGAQLSVTEDVAGRMLSVPFHAQMTDEEIDRVADALIELAPA
jgi:perosamine synthetase